MPDDLNKSEDRTIVVGGFDSDNVAGVSHVGDATVLVSSLASDPAPVAASSVAAVDEEPTLALLQNRFELKQLLGAGGMGAVYRALDRRKVEASDREPMVAIKVLNSDFKDHPQAIVSLQREARKSQQLAHPNIVNVYDFDRDDDVVYMTMEYMDGAPLDELIREKSGIGFELEAAKTILSNISSALDYAHKKNIIHSDFKPGNIFVLKDGSAKVFDFGIARAVSSQNVVQGTGVTTLFDAASLGALTPAYASYEMLSGGEPSPSDDIYALACVAYELFSGRHPFNKVAADKAKEQGLKPDRLKNLSRREWKVLAKGLSFQHGDRYHSVADFSDSFYGRGRWQVVAVVSAIVLSLSLSASGYYQYVNTVDEEVLREDIAADMSLKFERDRVSKELRDLIKSNLLTDAWDSEIKQLLAEYGELAPLDTALALEIQSALAAAYLVEANGLIDRGSLMTAERYISKAESWGDTVNAHAIRNQLDELQSAEVIRVAEQQRIAQQNMLEAELIKQKKEEQARVRAARDQQIAQQKAAAMERKKTIAAAGQSLTCNGLDIQNNASTKITLLKQRYPDAYKSAEAGFIEKILDCVDKQQVTRPSEAEMVKRQAMALFPMSTALAKQTIDYCLRLKPGSGGRSNRNICKDRITSSLYSPVMVSVAENDRRFAIGKYEVSEREFSIYCRDTGCGHSASSNKPVTNISIEEARGYLGWLSRKTGFSYRLPNYADWYLSASAANSKIDADRNCYLRYAGIEKGNVLVDVSTGKKNRFGLVNAVGNAQEWVMDGDSVVAAGGNRRDAMSECLVTTMRPHSGQADSLTGFRFIRDI
ncbi:Serine/threonine-protein kinase PknD [Sinobacterium norvegicum]|uniref:Serine/threonine-protein kinase PknD n=1 Tax=Sinobacterium norvegicum TaxID=1641715 RepID=A0ABM9AAC0_9GAMM|nr:bifunctional serine/threonine-protein kinase/formylglycine-generating enzyme family protein [Sinobacterium norvegicum]CAH0990151.1 Serine/threonine-protein kinase PknD [Sinobacterium norvegicum]